MSLRVCSEPSCPVLVPSGRCPEHRAEREKARGTRQARGYDASYQRARDAAVAGATHCATCGQPFTQDNPATGGHAIPQREGGTTADGIKPECRRCNYGWRRTGS